MGENVYYKTKKGPWVVNMMVCENADVPQERRLAEKKRKRANLQNCLNTFHQDLAEGLFDNMSNTATRKASRIVVPKFKGSDACCNLAPDGQ